MGEGSLAKRIGVGALVVIALCCVVVTAILVEAHIEMRGITPAIKTIISSRRDIPINIMVARFNTGEFYHVPKNNLAPFRCRVVDIEKDTTRVFL